MEFLSKILQRKPAKSGGGGGSSPASTTPVAISKPDHEANVQFAREFVVELVETVPRKSEKAYLAKHADKEDLVSLKSVSPSESSFQSTGSAAENTSLPDLLQPEFVYKKQTDTDTDTTEYESAAETDPLDPVSPIGSFIAEDLLASFQEALDKKYPPSEKEEALVGNSVEPEVVQNAVTSTSDRCKTDNSVSLETDPSPLSEVYEDAGDTIVKPEVDVVQVNPLDISGLCLCINNLCLDSPRNPEKSNCGAAVDYLSSNSDIPIGVSEGSAVEERADKVEVANVPVVDITFVVEDSFTELRDEVSDAIDEVVSPNKETAVLIEADKTSDLGDSVTESNVLSVAENSTETAERVKSEEKVQLDSTVTEKHEDTLEEVPVLSVHVEEDTREAEVVVIGNSLQGDVAEDVQKLDVPEEIDINSISVEVDTNSKTSISSNPFEEISLNKSVTSSFEEPKNVFESKSSPDLDSTWTSTSLEVLNVEKEATSEFAEAAVNKKPDSLPPIRSTDVGAGDWKVSVEKHEEPEFVKDPPTVLSKLFEICNRQQKDLELGDEEFVDGKEFFASPSKSGNTREAAELPHKSSHLEFDVVRSGPRQFADFDQSIADEAKRISQEFINASSEFDEASVTTGDSRRSSGSTEQTSTVSSVGAMAETRGVSNTTIVDENAANPFLTQSSLRRSPPPPGKPSPRPSNQGASPCESPRSKSRLSKDGSSPRDHASGDASPRSRSGKNSPDRRVSSNKVSSVEVSPKHLINPEVNQSEAGPDIAEDAHLQGGDVVIRGRMFSNLFQKLAKFAPECGLNTTPSCSPVSLADVNLYPNVFKDPAAFEYLSSMGNSHPVTDLRKESLYVKFDPLVGGISKTTDKCVPLPPSVEVNSVNSVPVAASPVKEMQSGNTTPVKNPAMSVIDKLISLSPSPIKPYIVSPVKQPVTTPVRQETTEISFSNVISDNAAMVEELYRLREVISSQDEKHREKVIHLEQGLVTLRGHVENLQSLVRESEARETKLNKKVVEEAQAQKQMSIIMEEYEKTISKLVAEKEQERQAHELDRSTLLKDRDTVMGHLANIEVAFSDLHKKYERSKTVIEGFKKNEEVLRASLAEYEGTIRKQEQKYDVLKSHAMAQLENANQELDSVRRSQHAETAKLKAMLKKAEVKTSSLEEMLEQKVKENQELASICDELINKVGSSD